jgi:hypothetical protein
MDPLQWFQQNVINRVAKGGAMPKPGGAIVATTAGQLLNPTGIQQISTNMKVPGGGKLVGRGNALVAGGALLEAGLASMNNEYGRKVAAARDQRESGLDELANLGIGGVLASAFQPDKKLGVGDKPIKPPKAPAAGLDTGTGKKDVKDPMAIWAEKYKDTLAPKVKQGQSGYDTIQDVLGASTQDERDAASDRMVMGGNAAESMAGAKGANLEVVIDGSGPETVTIKPQEFKDSAMGKILNNYKNPNVTPLVEGMTLPTTTDYTGAFNQADMNTVNIFKDTGVMDEISRTYGGNTPSYTQGRNFRSLF